MVNAFVNSCVTSFLKKNNLYPPIYDMDDDNNDSPHVSVVNFDIREEALEQFDVTGITPLPSTPTRVFNAGVAGLEEFDITGIEPLPSMQFDEEKQQEVPREDEIGTKPIGLDARMLDTGRAKILGKPMKRIIGQEDFTKKPRIQLKKIPKTSDSWSTQEAHSYFAKRDLDKLLPKGKNSLFAS